MKYLLYEICNKHEKMDDWLSNTAVGFFEVLSWIGVKSGVKDSIF
jgi:hypothetical protein